MNKKESSSSSSFVGEKIYNDNFNLDVYVQLQSKIWQELYALYRSATNSGSNKDTITEVFCNHLTTKFNFSSAQATKISKILIDQFQHTTDSANNELFVAHSDFADIRSKLASEKDGKVIKFIIALVAYTRTHNHPSGWIKYDRKLMFYLAGLSKLKIAEQEKIVSYIHFNYGFDMQVVGSNQPIPCFKISWLAPAGGDTTPENALVSIGPSTPSTINSFLFVLFPPANKATNNK